MAKSDRGWLPEPTDLEWIERAAGPTAPYHPRYGPECPTPAIPR